MRWLRCFAVGLAIAFSWFVGVSSGQSGPSSLAALRDTESALVQLINKAESSIVAVSRSRQAAANPAAPSGVLQLENDPFGRLRRTRTAPPATTAGAGVVIDRRGLVLTQYLVIQPGDLHFIATVDGKTYPAQIKAADPRSGLAVLEVSGADLQPLPIGKAESLGKGSFVVALGNPSAIVADGQPAASLGTVVNLGQKVAADVNLNNTPAPGQGFRTTLHHFGTLIQTDARLGWSSPGGALINLKGELVGITTTASVTAGHEQPAGYAIPLNKTFRRVVSTLSEGEEVEYGLLGIEYRPEGDSNSNGVAVSKALVGGPASRAGLQSGDRITEIAGTPIRRADDLQLTVGALPPSTETPVTFTRAGRSETTNVMLAKYHVPGNKIVTSPKASWRGIRVDYPTAIPPRQFQESQQLGKIDPLGCVVVTEVSPESVSWQSGVRPGMFISHVGDQRVATPGEFTDAVENADTSVSLRFTGTRTPAPEQRPGVRAPVLQPPIRQPQDRVPRP